MVDKTVNDLTEDGSPVATDFVMTWDVSAGAAKKATLTNIAQGASSPLTTKGDVFGFDSSDARIPIGTNGQVLTADSAQTLGLKWATAAGGGDVTKVGTPVNNEIGVWTGDGTLEGEANLTYDGTELIVSTANVVIASNSRIVFDGTGGDTYLSYNSTSNKLELFVDGVKKMQWG